jgi:type VI secretion system protein ImpK
VNLSELCEPFFLYICRLNRAARKGGRVDFASVRSEIAGLFKSMQSAASKDAHLSEQYRQVEMPLTFFADSIISESGLNIAGQWNQNRLAFARNELAGDEKFFDLLNETLADSSEAAAERLAIFYTCLGLGFSGWYAGQTDKLKQKMNEVAARIRDVTHADPNSRICPEAYEHVDRRDLIQPPSQKLIGIAIALAGLTIVLFLTNLFLYREASHDLSVALQAITAFEPHAGPAPASPASSVDNQ